MLPLQCHNDILAKRPSFINLENDPVIEDHTKLYFKENGYELSAITGLRQFDTLELMNLLNEFHSLGGTGVYVYTQCLDFEQMQSYVHAVEASDLDCLIIDFVNDIPAVAMSIIENSSIADLQYSY